MSNSRRLASSESIQPPLLVALTGYRLLCTSSIVAFGTAKAVYSYQSNGQAGLITTLDWIMGVAITVILYWVGLYEAVRPPVLVWFFHVDLARPIFHAGWRFIWVAVFMSLGMSVLTIAILPCVATFFIITFITTQQLLGLICSVCLFLYYLLAGPVVQDYPFRTTVTLLLRIKYLRKSLQYVARKLRLPALVGILGTQISHQAYAIPREVYHSESTMYLTIDVLATLPGYALALGVFFGVFFCWARFIVEPLQRLLEPRLAGVHQWADFSL
ncbi:hypothetical protein EIP91_007612 [Steccherinum ochraceum]|uniref:Uncharacterized protein n=1 Tax=Steccherinum ochraceum TaxID=92696 RepID=A0A4V2MVE3_9APHY|nr:hypothetical protein EIP91_007612 [Steccherinum ochraceum]